MKQKPYRPDRGFNRLILVWTGAVFFMLFFPILIIILMSFNHSNYGMLPFEFTLKWYGKLFAESDLFPATWFSLRFSALVALGASLLGAAASLALRSCSSGMRGIFNSAMSVPIIVPWLVQSIALLMIFNLFGLGKSYASLYLGNLLAAAPYAFLLCYNTMMAADRSPEEAALTLGAPGVRVFFDITLPMIFPGVLAGALMAFMVCFNNFVMQYYLAPFGVRTLPMEIFTLIRVGFKPDMNALSSLMCVFSIIIVLLLTRLGFSAGRFFGRKQEER
jgi:spermidine/putrescine transport system permease protein